MNDRPSAIRSGKWKVEGRNFCFLLCTFCFLLPAGGQNLIKNGDFEAPLGPDNWTVVYAAVTGSPAAHPPSTCGPEDFMVQDRTTMAHKDRVVGVWDGNYSGGHFRANSDWLMHAYFKQTVTNLIPGSNYIVRAWMSQVALVDKVDVYLEVMGGPAGWLSLASAPMNTNVWESHSVTNSASNSGQIEVRLHYNRNDWTSAQKWRNSDAFYDHVSVMTSTQAPPIIVTQPASTNICPGETAVLAVSSTGSGLTYQWYYNTYTRIIGATNATLTIPNAQSANTGYYSVDVSNGYDVTSSNALLRVGTTFTQQPASTNICPGGNATFTVAAYGVGTVLYQWQRNGANLSNGGHYSGATTTTLTVTSADTNDAASYSCVVTSACGSVTSSVASLALSGANLTQQPSNATVGLGCAASFTIAGTGCGALTYQWQKNQTNLNNGGHYSGCTTAALTVSGIDGNDQANYRCAVTDGPVTTYSTNATLTITTDCAPCGLQNGDFEGGNTGGVATGWTGYQRAPNPTTVWSIQTASPPTGGGLQYQQILNTSSTGSAGVRQDIIGCAIGATYNVSGWMRGNSTNATCTVKCSPAASTDWSTAIDLDPPQAYTGSDWTAFSGTVVATGTLMTIWLDGQTGGTGQNDAECFDSVSVTCAAPPPPPDITQQPIGTNICPGATATFTVAATGLGTITYQWQRNQDDLSDGGHYSGTTTPTLIVSSASSGDAADYRCVLTYAGSSTNSDEAALTLKTVTAITAQPTDQTLNAGGTASFTVTATGDGTLTYQWQTNGVNLSNGNHYAGCSAATLWVTNVTSADIVNYRCLVTGGCGSATSSLVMLAINTCNPGDLLGHGNMEDASSYSVCPDWTSYSSGAGVASWNKEATDPSLIHGGSAAQRCRNQNGASGSLLGVHQTVDATVGDAFTFEGWVYPMSIPAYQQVAMVATWDGSTANPTTNSSTTWNVSTGAREAWTQLQNLSGNATATTVTLFLDSRRITGSIDISAYWDDVVCYRTFVPPAPAVIRLGITSFNVNVTPGCNWTNSSAQYAITIGGGAYTLGTHWVQADGSVGTSAVWQTDAAWATTTVTGLWGGTTYTLKVQARYSSTHPQATSLGAGAMLTTDGPAPPTITQHPPAQNVCPNATAAFSVTATGGGTITYQWQKDSVNLSNGGHYSGVTTANLTVSTVDANDTANYRCVVSNEGGNTPSSEAALTLKAATTITGEPSAQIVCLGANPTFNVTATGEGTLTYQWQTNGVNLSNNSHYGGCTTVTLTVTNAGPGDAVNYRCVVTATCGNATSSAPALTLKAATVITSDPSVQNVCPGSDAMFTVVATGDGTLTYQWQTNGVDISDDSHYGGCTTATLWVTNVSSADAVNYRCVVSGGCGSANSGTAALTLKAATAITDEPLAQNVCLGSNATFTVTATGDGTLTYQWRTNGVDLGDNSHYGGCTTASLTVTNVGSNDVANYACVVSGSCGSATSSAPALTLKAVTTITQQPSDQSVALSSNATFSVVATGDGTLTYQWRKNGDDLTDGGHYSGVMTAVLTISGANGSDLGVYACEVSGGCGSVTSSNGALSVSYGVTNDYAVNRAVPDASFTGVSDTRSISTAIHSVTNLKVRLKISGTYNGDLFCYVTHGSGYSVLLNRVGRTASSAFGYGDPGLDVAFDDGATNDVHDYRLTVTGNHSNPLGTNLMGTWVADGRTNRPSEVLDTDGRPALLSRFTGLDPNGDWTVFVADVGGGDSHTLVSWGLEMSGTEEPSAPPVATISGTVKLQAYLGSSRVVRFIASAVAGGVTNYLQTNEVNLSFTAGEADYSIDVPTNTTHLSAKTAWHLRKRLPVTFVGGAATNDFTGTDWLLGGDLVTAIGSTSIDDTDNLVNAVDLGLLLGYYLSAIGSDPLIGRADIDGDPIMDMVNAVDLSILLGNYLLPGDGP